MYLLKRRINYYFQHAKLNNNVFIKYAIYTNVDE